MQLNASANIDRLLLPDDVRKIREAFPSLLDALKMQQTVITQLVVRVGGSGSGSSTTDLTALTARVDHNSALIELNDELINQRESKQGPPPLADEPPMKDPEIDLLRGRVIALEELCQSFQAAR